MKKTIWLCLAALLAQPLYCVIAQSTPYWSEEDFLRSGQQIEKRMADRISLTPKSVDDYLLLFEYTQICDFLVAMQEQNPESPDYGGMHEGENADLWSIVETDNTQEAIRVWSTYGELSGDIEKYYSNIVKAWIYIMNYPAYEEEGETDYYRVHNCGWGLVAEAKYRKVYSDVSYLWYADACADYIRTHRLSYGTGYYGSLHPLVEGWAAGTLYDYGIEHGDSASVAHALEVGADVQAWIEDDPVRLSTNEVWAMCGGTAMWGVCRSVFADDPAAGQAWLPQYLPYMDTYAGAGQWNNSWNVWYAHAYHASATVTGDPLNTQLAYALVDTLLDADTDNDGGIMATSTDPPTADQSWVSCYLDYMGMEALINQLPIYDAAAAGFWEPDSVLPVAQGEPSAVYVLVGNSGSQAFGAITVNVSGAFTGSGSTYLDFGEIDTVDAGFWTPTELGPAQLIMTLSPGGAVSENDTASIWVDVIGWGTIAGNVTDSISGAPIPANLAFYRYGFPDEEPLFTTQTDSTTGYYTVDVLEGTYRIVVDPQIPYTDRQAEDIIAAVAQTTEVDFYLNPADILLVDDDGGDEYEEYYCEPLADGGYDAFWWDSNLQGAPAAELLLFDVVIWFTGDETENTLTAAETSALTAFLDQGGGLLISGQNIAEDIQVEPFLADYLGASLAGPSSGFYQIFGVEGDPVTSGISLILLGGGGANNQTSMDMIAAVPPGELAMYYNTADDPGAAIRIDNSYKLMFLSFGLEAAAGVGGTYTRQEFLTEIMQWFEMPSSIAENDDKTIPENFAVLKLSPNPFNSEVQIQFSLSLTTDVKIQIFNIHGQQVTVLPMGILKAGIHRIPYKMPVDFGSGIYFFQMNSPAARETIRGVLIK